MIPGVIPLVLAGAGLLSFTAAALVLRSYGPRYRIGRLLAVAPRVTVGEAVRLAEAGAAPYVRVEGRIDSDDEFEDDAHRPLVFRRTTIEWREPGGRWRPIDASTEVVPFSIHEELDAIDIPGERLELGLVVIPRQAVGAVGDLGERAPAGVDPAAVARLTIEQLSSIEHATVLGVPTREADGRVVMAPGRGRPLVLTPLEQDEAMRVLAGGETRRARVAIALLVLAGFLVVGAVVWWLLQGLATPAAALAASPAATFGPGADTRSSGGGPGLVGDPVLALGVVAGIAVASVLATLVYVRLTTRRGPTEGPARRP